MNIVITVPDTRKEGIEKLIEFYKNQNPMDELFFKVPFLPKRCEVGDLCFIVSNSTIIGCHTVEELRFVKEDEASKLSDGNWTEGFYIIRSAVSFQEAKNKPKVKGFRGFRYLDSIPLTPKGMSILE
jgi:hypothetical protein